MSNQKWRIAGINFDHFHMGDLLRQTAEHPNAEIVGICDEQPARMVDAARNFGLTPDQVFTDHRPAWSRRSRTSSSFVPPPPSTASGSKKSRPLAPTSSWKNPSPARWRRRMR
jgi:hypothetical protein